MKRKTSVTVTRTLYFIIFTMILLFFPEFFRMNPNLRFLWGVLSATGICMQIFYLTSHSSKRKKRVTNALLLLFSTLMAYDMGNWDAFISLFPSISEFSQPSIMLRILTVLFCSGLLGGTLLAIRRHYARNRRRRLKTPLIAPQPSSFTKETTGAVSSVTPGAAKGAYMDSTVYNAPPLQHVGKSGNSSTPDSLTVSKAAGSVIIFVGVIAAVVTTAALLLKNREVLEKLNLQSVQILVNASAWFILLLCLVSLLLVTIAYVIWLIKTVIIDIFQYRKFTLENPPFLKLLSCTLMLVVGVVFYNTDIDGWFSFLKKPDEIAPILKGLFISFLLILLSQVAYRMLFSLFNPDSNIRKAANKLYLQFFKCATSIFFTLLTPAAKSSCLLKKNLPCLAAKMYKWIKCYFFDADVSKTGLEKKIWYPFAWGSLFFSIVSFIGTANGMSQCIFNGNLFISALVSMGIQVFLLTFNLHLPKLLLNCTLFKKRTTMVFYAIVIISSSFFSFTFISQTIYAGTWMQDAHIEMSDIFLSASSQLHAMADEIYQDSSGKLSEVIVSIQKDLSSNEAALEKPDFTEIGEALKSDTELAGIAKVLSGPDNISASILDRCEETLNRKTIEIVGYLSRSEKEIKKTEAKIEEQEKDINELIKQRYTVSLNSPAHISYTEQIDNRKLDLQNSRNHLDEEKFIAGEYEKKSDAISQLASYLHSFETQSIGVVSSQLSEILSQLASSTPDLEQIDSSADEVFSQITQNVDAQSDGSAGYAAMMAQMATFKTTLSSLKVSRNAQNWLKDNQSFIFEADGLVRADASETDVYTWRAQWSTALSGIKNHLSTLEPYVNTENKAEIDQLYTCLSVLKRNYLLDLNAIETAKNCLLGDHPTLARIALLIAFYLDTAPVFVSFILADGQTAQTSKRRSPAHAAFAGANLALLIFIVWPLIK